MTAPDQREPERDHRDAALAVAHRRLEAMRKPVLTARQVLLCRRLAQANVAADEAIATYNARKAALAQQHRGSPSAFELACRDDVPLSDASRAEGFNTRLANRLALTLLVELQLSGVRTVPAQGGGS